MALEFAYTICESFQNLLTIKKEKYFFSSQEVSFLFLIIKYDINDKKELVL